VTDVEEEGCEGLRWPAGAQAARRAGSGASPGGGGSGGGALCGGEACGGAGLEEELQPWEAPSLPRFLFLYCPSYII
jgi:hypothetical protein